MTLLSIVLDAAVFDAFNRCSDPPQLERHARYFAEDVESVVALQPLMERTMTPLEITVGTTLRAPLDVLWREYTAPTLGGH